MNRGNIVTRLFREQQKSEDLLGILGYKKQPDIDDKTKDLEIINDLQLADK